jgi:hypothetical protein
MIRLALQPDWQTSLLSNYRYPKQSPVSQLFMRPKRRREQLLGTMNLKVDVTLCMHLLGEDEETNLKHRRREELRIAILPTCFSFPLLEVPRTIKLSSALHERYDI